MKLVAERRTRYISQPEPRDGLPALRESPERAEPSVGGGIGDTPNPSRSPSRQRSRRVSGGRVQRAQPLRRGHLGYPQPLPLRFPPGKRAGVRRESPERAQPLRRGHWGTPNPSHSASRQGSGRMSGGRVQRGRSLFGGGIGVPPTPPTPLPASEASGCPAGESREGGALFGGGLGVPPNLYPLRFPPGKRADLRRGIGART